MNEQTNAARVQIPLSSGATIKSLKINLNTPKAGALRQLLKFIGPAFIVSVAYIDPGNFVLEHL